MRPPVSCDLRRAGHAGHTQEGAREKVPSPLLCPLELPLARPNQDQKEGKVKSLSRVRLFATPWTVCSPPGSLVHGIFQA